MTERFYSPVIKYTTSNLTSLPGAKLYFTETGTSTPKTTWQDPERTTPHAHPVVALADGTFPPIFINGVYRAELKNAAGVTQPGWPVDDVGAPAAGFPFQSWSSTYRYSEDDLVTYGGEFYQSLDDNNVGNTPSTATLFWRKKLFLDAPTAESYLNGNSDGTYTWRTIAQTKSDLSLPTDTVSELALKAPIASPTFTGNPTAPTPAANDNDTSIATTAYVQTELLDRPQTVATIAVLTALTGLTDGQQFSVVGYNSGTTIGGGLFKWDSASVVAEDGGDVFESDAGGAGRFIRLNKSNDAANFGVYPGSADNTASLTAAFAARKTVRIYEQGEYKLEDFTAISNRDLLLDAGVELIGVTTSSDIIVSSSSTIRFNVVGGKVKDCNNFWTHTGNSALAYCKFSNVQFNDLAAGFDLTSSVGNTWDKCEFGVGGSADNIDYGIYFRATGTGQTNINRIVDCNFLLFALGGIVFADTTINKIANIIRGCWFEDSATSAIYVGGTTQNLIIDGGYSETCGAAGVPDINIVQSVGSAIIGLKICNVTFQIHNAGQTERIKNTGNSYIKVEDCQVVLNEAGSVFCAVNGASTFHTELYNNYLNATGGGTYQSRLYSRSGTQQVSWSTHVASGVVTNDDQPLRYNEGVDVGNWTTFTNADATPSVRGGNRFKTAGTTTITTFDDGFDGQEIIVKAGNTITVVGVAMVLNDVAEFVNDGGTWRHKNL